jgi:hypothetical protein
LKHELDSITVDVAALAITGVLTGFFLAFGLTPTHKSTADR